MKQYITATQQNKLRQLIYESDEGRYIERKTMPSDQTGVPDKYYSGGTVEEFSNMKAQIKQLRSFVKRLAHGPERDIDRVKEEALNLLQASH